MKTKCCVAMLFALACSSCGRQVALYPVSGTAKYLGAPAAGATVFLHGRGSAADLVITGSVQADGSFELVCGNLGKGAPPGTYDVLISWPVSCNPGKGCCERKADKLAGRYADPRNPRFQATIKAGANQLPPFDLE